jgi:hypothetical protein
VFNGGIYLACPNILLAKERLRECVGSDLIVIWVQRWFDRPDVSAAIRVR